MQAVPPTNQTTLLPTRQSHDHGRAGPSLSPLDTGEHGLVGPGDQTSRNQNALDREILFGEASVGLPLLLGLLLVLAATTVVAVWRCSMRRRKRPTAEVGALPRMRQPLDGVSLTSKRDLPTSGSSYSQSGLQPHPWKW